MNETEKVIEQAAAEMARRAMEDVRMKARREWTETLRDMLRSEADSVDALIRRERALWPDWLKTRVHDAEDYVAGMRSAVTSLDRTLSNPLNWRTP